MTPIFIIGDIHGHYEPMLELLRAAGIISQAQRWAAADAHVWWMGDFFDRGPDGISAVDLVMRLQREAAAAGGQASALIGNHDPLLLAAARFGSQPSTGPGGTFLADWQHSGGAPQDLQRLQPHHISWLSSRPALAREGDWLLAHADAMFYLNYGRTIAEVNRAFAACLRSSNADEWDQLLDDFSERNAFAEGEAAQRLDTLLGAFGGRQLIHGHTPISKMTGQDPRSVRQALVYADGRCVNVDGGMYLGGPGFIHELREAAR